MARKKISEYKAKQLILKYISSNVVQVQPMQKLAKHTSADEKTIIKFLEAHKDIKSWVIKVDQGIKKRGKLGLLGLNCDLQKLVQEWKRLTKLGYGSFIIEPFLPHNQEAEKYISWERVRGGWQLLYSNSGGIEVEANSDKIQRTLLKPATDKGPESFQPIAKFLSLPDQGAVFLEEFTAALDRLAIAFAEINPLVLIEDRINLLDLAVEVDSAGSFIAQRLWDETDFVEFASEGKTKQELAIKELDAKSQASLKFELLNPDGAVWLLLSGGGASIVVADEIFDLGKSKLLANYGEYSGNPNADETYIYTKNVIQLLLQSKSKQKVLIIAGGVANFTDIRLTFKGVIKALGEFAAELRAQSVQVFVRRGGPYQTEGLASMKKFLEGAGLLGHVSGPDLPLTDIVHLALTKLNQHA